MLQILGIEVSVNKIADSGHHDHQAYISGGFLGAHHAANDQHVGQTQGRSSQKQRQGRTLSHAGTDQSLQDGHLFSPRGGYQHRQRNDAGRKGNQRFVREKKRQDQNRGSRQSDFIGFDAKPLYQQDAQADGKKTGQGQGFNHRPGKPAVFQLQPENNQKNADNNA